jgi:hypothetical protein
MASLCVSFVLPLSIRCRVCGLRLATSSMMRRINTLKQGRYLMDLKACPICGDDGRATHESRRRWVASGSPREAPYWSARRLGLALLAIVAIAVLLEAWRQLLIRNLGLLP